MSDILDTLHPEGALSDNLYPNIKKDNIPNKAIDIPRLGDDVINLLSGLNQPKYYDISSLPTTDVGLIVGSDGYIYSWNGSSYINTNIVYQATSLDARNIGAIEGLYNNEIILDGAGSWSAGYYDTSAVLHTPSNSWLYSNPIYIKKGYSITIDNASGYSSATLAFTRYDNNTGTTTPLVLGIASQTKYTYEALEDTYIIVTYNKVSATNFKLSVYKTSILEKTDLQYITSGLSTVSFTKNNSSGANLTFNVNIPKDTYYEIIVGRELYNACNLTAIGLNGETLALGTLNYGTTYSFTSTFDIIALQGYFNFANAIINLNYTMLGLTDLTKYNIVKYVGVGKDFETLRSAVDFANKHPHSTIIITKGEYDLIQEFGGIDNMPAAIYGLMIGNDTTYIFEEGSLVKALYTGDSEYVKNNFAVFTANADSEFNSYKIIGLKAIAQNTRYIIHDEMDNRVNSYSHEYYNCDLTLDNTNSSTSYKQCIGGGLGCNGRIVIKDCYFNSVNISNDDYGVSYHNQVSQEGQSFITISGNYLENGTIAMIGYGNYAQKSKAFISNNSIKSNVVYDSSVTDNIDVKQWNNEIRS